MAKDKGYRTLTIGAAGSTTAFPLTDGVDFYNITSSSASVVLAGNVAISGSGTPVIGSTYTILVNNGFVLGANTFTVFGYAFTAAQCLYNQIVFCYYNGTTWDVYVMQDNKTGSDDIDGADIVSSSITNTQIASAAAIAWSKLAPSAGSVAGHTLITTTNGVVTSINAATSGGILVGNGTIPALVAVSGDATLAASGALTLANNAVTTAKITDSNVTLVKLETILKTEVLPLTVSFETGEQTGYSLTLPYACTVVGVTGVVVKAIAATDAGTITGSCNGVNMTAGVITCAASDALGITYSITPTANNVLAIGQVLKFVTLKTTVGGKVILSVSLIRA